jgi:hypothetical protein
MKNHAYYKHKTARIMRNTEFQKRMDIKIEVIGKKHHLTDIKTKK